MRRLLWLAGVVLGARTVAHWWSGRERAAGGGDAAGSAAGASGPEGEAWPEEAWPEEDSAILALLHAIDEHQVALADIVLSRPVDDEIARLAGLLRDEHHASQARTRELVDALGLESAPSPAASDVERRYQKRLERLRGIEGDALREQYLASVIEEHEWILLRLDELIERDTGLDPRLAEQLKRMREHIQQHLAEARMVA